MRDSDTVGRIGGDEFALLLVGCPLEKARQIADDVVRSVNDYRFVWKDKIFNIGVSIGLVEIGRGGGAIEDIMNSADSACYVAKKQGGVHVHVYSAREEANARHSGEIHWLQKLQGALRDNKFELYYQPIVHAQADVVRGPALEVFVRMEAENGQPGAPPAEFIRAAERYRLMPHVDRWVVQTVLSALGRGGMKLPPGRSVAINISGQTLGDSEFLEFVVDCFDHTGANPGDICFEVTESSVVANLDHARRFIAVLHGMGCEFALDDFGSGSEFFSTLKTLPMDYLKIDGSFIRNLAVDTVNQAMVGAMIELSRSLQLPHRRRAGRGSAPPWTRSSRWASTSCRDSSSAGRSRCRSRPVRLRINALITAGQALITKFYGISPALRRKIRALESNRGAPCPSMTTTRSPSAVRRWCASIGWMPSAARRFSPRSRGAIPPTR